MLSVKQFLLINVCETLLPALRYHRACGALIFLLLTYMSIRVEINRRMNEGRLSRALPALDDAAIVRTIFVSEEIRDLLLGPWPNVELEFSMRHPTRRP